MTKKLPPITSTIAARHPMVKLITYIVGMFDPYGIDHSERVALLCMKMAQQISMTDADVEELEMAALLHDIGKLGIPESIRAKPGALTDAEFFMMKQHPIIGRKILEQMNGGISRRVHAGIYYHHENYGGSGYPEGLSGDAIPTIARIIRIADTYDAITHTRGYRLSAEKEEALALMERDHANQNLFDPKLFEAFLDMMRKHD